MQSNMKTSKARSAIILLTRQIIDNKHFINDLPTSLGIELAYIIHKEIYHNIPFFQVAKQ